MEIDFKNKVVLVTGGSRGIGAACVKLFADSGAQIAFTYNTNEDAANQIIAGYNFELKMSLAELIFLLIMPVSGSKLKLMKWI